METISFKDNLLLNIENSAETIVIIKKLIEESGEEIWQLNPNALKTEILYRLSNQTLTPAIEIRINEFIEDFSKTQMRKKAFDGIKHNPDFKLIFIKDILDEGFRSDFHIDPETLELAKSSENLSRAEVIFSPFGIILRLPDNSEMKALFRTELGREGLGKAQDTFIDGKFKRNLVFTLNIGKNATLQSDTLSQEDLEDHELRHLAFGNYFKLSNLDNSKLTLMNLNSAINAAEDPISFLTLETHKKRASELYKVSSETARDEIIAYYAVGKTQTSLETLGNPWFDVIQSLQSIYSRMEVHQDDRAEYDASFAEIKSIYGQMFLKYITRVKVFQVIAKKLFEKAENSGILIDRSPKENHAFVEALLQSTPIDLISLLIKKYLPDIKEDELAINAQMEFIAEYATSEELEAISGEILEGLPTETTETKGLDSFQPLGDFDLTPAVIHFLKVSIKDENIIEIYENYENIEYDPISDSVVLRKIKELLEAFLENGTISNNALDGPLSSLRPLIPEIIILIDEILQVA